MEHLEGVIDKPEKEMSPQELQLHYFKMHDYDGNSLLDGLELSTAITHVHKEVSQGVQSGRIWAMPGRGDPCCPCTSAVLPSFFPLSASLPLPSSPESISTTSRVCGSSLTDRPGSRCGFEENGGDSRTKGQRALGGVGGVYPAVLAGVPRQCQWRLLSFHSHPGRGRHCYSSSS